MVTTPRIIYISAQTLNDCLQSVRFYWLNAGSCCWMPQQQCARAFLRLLCVIWFAVPLGDQLIVVGYIRSHIIYGSGHHHKTCEWSTQSWYLGIRRNCSTIADYRLVSRHGVPAAQQANRLISHWTHSLVPQLCIFMTNFNVFICGDPFIVF